MKKLLLCSKTCQDEDNLEESDDADVIVESLQEKSHPMKSFRREMENLENLNFNYDVIVKFVKQGKYQLVLAGFIVISCAETGPRLSASQSDLFWNASLETSPVWSLLSPKPSHNTSLVRHQESVSPIILTSYSPVLTVLCFSLGVGPQGDEDWQSRLLLHLLLDAHCPALLLLREAQPHHQLQN